MSLRLNKHKLKQWQLHLIINNIIKKIVKKWVVWPILFLALALPHLGKFIFVDEPHFLYKAVPQLYEALRNCEWDRTFVSDKPAFITALLSGVVTLFTNFNQYDYTNAHHYLFWWRLPIVLFCATCIAIAYQLCKPLLGQKKAALWLFAIVVCPLLIGVSQMVNADATAWSAALVTWLAFHRFWQTGYYKFAFLSGCFMGLAMLSKYNTLIFYPFFLLSGYLFYLHTDKNNEKAPMLPLVFRQRLYGLALLLLISIITYWIVFPAAWTNLNELWRGTIGSKALRPVRLPVMGFTVFLVIDFWLLRGHISEWLRNKLALNNWFLRVLSGFFAFGLLFLLLNQFLGFLLFNYEVEKYGAKISTYFSTSFGSSLLISGYNALYMLGFAIVAGFGAYCIYGLLNRQQASHLQLSAILFILAYLGGLALLGIWGATRYQAILMPMYLLIGIEGLCLLPRPNWVLPLALAITTLETFWVAPFGLHFTNIINFTNRSVTMVQGHGGYEVAQFLNAQPNASQLRIWTDRGGFKPFFAGIFFDADKRPEAAHAHYLVLTDGGYKMYIEQTQLPYLKPADQAAFIAKYAWLKPYYQQLPEWELHLGHNPRSYVRIVRTAEPLPGAKPNLNLYNDFFCDTLQTVPANAPFSISVWILPGDNAILQGGNSSKYGLYLTPFESNSNGAKFKIGYHSLNQTIFDNTTEKTYLPVETPFLSNNKWQHIIISQYGGARGSTFKVYINGQLADTGFVPEYQSGVFAMGVLPQAQNYVQDLQIYPFLLNSSQIDSLYKAGP